MEIVGQRPRQAGGRGPGEVVADRRARQVGRDGDLGWREGLGLGKPQDFSDLAHSRTGTGHRHLSSMDFIDREGAVSDDLTSVRLAISETRWPLRVKRAAKTRETRGQFRRNQVANSREIRWRKPVKSAVMA
jgi:hypothetical protein